MCIPYIDSLIMALETRFSSENKPFYCLFELHPERIAKSNKAQFISQAAEISNKYEIDNFMEEASIWFDMWGTSYTKGVSFTQVVHWNISLIDLLDQSILFPAVNARSNHQGRSCHTGNNLHYRRLFSTLRREKT